MSNPILMLGHHDQIDNSLIGLYPYDKLKRIHYLDIKITFIDYHFYIGSPWGMVENSCKY